MNPILTNSLVHEKSLYLRQHAKNPVAWQSWGEGTFALAKTLKRPLFVSIGYAACHWCHVMERESFTDPAIAKLLNDYFVPIKIDREERPDIDAIYIRAAECMGVGAGWPLSIFADSQGHPFHIGTYFPPDRRHTLPGFGEVLDGIRKAWAETPDDIEMHAGRLVTKLKEFLAVPELAEPSEDTEPGAQSHHTSPTDVTTGSAKSEPSPMFTYFSEDKVYADLQKNYFDATFGGFKFHARNKFPPTMGLRLLMRIGHRERDPALLAMSERTLQGICGGGIFDQLRGGVARYSTDYAWHVPHFEKMLYDNVLLIEALLDVYLRTGRACYLEWALATADYLMAEMLSTTGGFMSSQDADSEGVEGKYFLWSYEELKKCLSASDFAFIQKIFAITETDNFEGGNILYYKEPYERLIKTVLRTKSARTRLEQIKRVLLVVRMKRTAPLTDEKILVSWNALAISALARLGTILNASEDFSDEGESANQDALAKQDKADLDRNIIKNSGKRNSHGVNARRGAKYIKCAERAFRFIDETLFNRTEQVLYRRYIDGEVRVTGLLTDYANLLAAGLDLYESTLRESYLKMTLEFLAVPLKYFWQAGRFYEQDVRVPLFIARYSEAYDSVEPAGNSKMAEVLIKLAAYDKIALTTATSPGSPATPPQPPPLPSPPSPSASTVNHLISSSAAPPLAENSPTQANPLSHTTFALDDTFITGTHWGKGECYLQYERMAEAIFTVHKQYLSHGGLPYMQRVLHDYRLGIRTLTLHGSSATRKDFIKVVARCYAPGLVLYGGRTRGEGCAVLCTGDRCLPPVHDPNALIKLITNDH